MKLAERIVYIGIILVLAFGWLKSPKNGVVVETIPGDSIPYKVEVIKPVPYDTIIYMWDTLQLAGDTIFLHDTIRVYDDYFKMYSYKVDTLVSEVNVSILSQVTQNRLYKQNISILNNRETKIISDPSNLIGVGIIVGPYILAPTISYQFNKHELGVGYDLDNKGFLISYEYKIKLK